jgi:hypothetical protein
MKIQYRLLRGAGIMNDFLKAQSVEVNHLDLNPDTGLAGGALTGAKAVTQDRNVRPLLDQHFF